MTGRGTSSSVPHAIPEIEALRILFAPVSIRAIYLLCWCTTALVLLSLMTYRSLQPLNALDVVVAVGLGALMPLAMFVGFGANQAAKRCHLPKTRRTGVSSALILSLFSTVISCMCCLPILPAVLGAALVGTASASQVSAWSVTLTTWAPWLYLGSAALLGWSLHQSSVRWVGLEAPGRTESSKA